MLTLFNFQFSFEKKKPKQIKIKYFEESVFAKESVKATEGSAGYDLFTAEAKTIVPNSSQIVCLDLRWAILKGFFSKVFPRSSLIKDRNVTVDGGLIDSDYRGLVYVLLCNHCKKDFTVRTGNRIAQVVFLEKFDVQFMKVEKKEDLGNTKRGDSGFGSTSVTVIKKMKTNEEISESQPETETDLEIASEEAILSVNDKVIIEEKKS